MVVEFGGDDSANSHPVSRVQPRPVNTVFEVFRFGDRVVESMRRQDVLVSYYVRNYFRLITAEQILAGEQEIKSRVYNKDPSDQPQSPTESLVG